MDTGGALPVTNRRRQARRDAKLDAREEALADRRRDRRRSCPCNLCLGENHSIRPRAQVQSHLALYGRHPYHRKSTQVCKSHFKFFPKFHVRDSNRFDNCQLFRMPVMSYYLGFRVYKPRLN